MAFSADLFRRPLLLSAFAETSDWISVECFCEELWPGFGSGRFSEGLLQGIPWSLSYGLLRRLAVNFPCRKVHVSAWDRVPCRNETLCLLQSQ